MKSKAETPYELLTHVQELSMAEPLRMNMSVWTMSPGTREKLRGNHRWVAPKEPPCGTVGCIAGWMTILRTSREQAEAGSDGDSYDWRHPEKFAGAILKAAGIPGNQVSAFFTFTPPHEIGTEDYVLSVVEHIENFKQKWETQLKAYKLGQVEG